MKELNCPEQLCLCFCSFQSRGGGQSSSSCLCSPLLGESSRTILLGPSSATFHSWFLAKAKSQFSRVRRGLRSHGVQLLPRQHDPRGSMMCRRVLLLQDQKPQAQEQNCIFNKYSCLLRHLVTQMEKNWGPERDMDLLRVTKQVLWLDQSRLIPSFLHLFIKTFNQH